MNILIFGGTFFGKRTLAKCSSPLVTLLLMFHEETAQKDKLEGLIGEREQLLDSLKGRVFDIVLDFFVL